MSNLFLNVGPIMAERFLFTPGFFLIVGLIAGSASLMQRITSRNPNQLFGVLLLVCIPFAYSKVLARNADWKNNSTLYQADLQKASDSFRVLAFNGIEKVSSVANLTDTTISNHVYQEAIRYFNRAFRIYPDYKNMYKEWGYAYLKLGQLDSAEWAWARFKTLNPSSQYHQINDKLLSEAKFSHCMEEYNAHYRDKNYAYLIGLLSRALQYKKEDAATLVNLGKVYYLNHQVDSAKACWSRALQSDSTNAEARSLIRLF